MKSYLKPSARRRSRKKKDSIERREQEIIRFMSKWLSTQRRDWFSVVLRYLA